MSDKEFYDLCYDAWRSGRNPDALSEDRYDTLQIVDGYFPDEITLEMMLQDRQVQDEETP